VPNFSFSQINKSKYLKDNTDSTYVGIDTAFADGRIACTRGFNIQNENKILNPTILSSKKALNLNSNWNELFQLFTPIGEKEFNKTTNLPNNFNYNQDYLFFVKDFVDSVAGVLFDDEFLLIEKSIYSSRTSLFFVKYFDIQDSAISYFHRNKSKFFSISTLDNRCESIWQWDKNGGSHVTFELSGFNVYLEIKKVPKQKWWETLFYKKCLFERSYQFRQIDTSNTFRGIKFGTAKSSILLKTGLIPVDYSKFIFQPTNRYYATWKDFNFDENVLFRFTKDNKLAAINLFFNTGEYTSETILAKLKSYFGEPSIFNSDENEKYYTWIGDNLNIKYVDKGQKLYDKYIRIESNLFLEVKEADY
jgi:hypothetical protein